MKLSYLNIDYEALVFNLTAIRNDQILRIDGRWDFLFQDFKMVECRLSLVAHFDDELVRNRRVLTEDIETGTHRALTVVCGKW